MGCCRQRGQQGEGPELKTPRYSRREKSVLGVVGRPVDLAGVLVHPTVPVSGAWGLTTKKTRTGASSEV